MTNQEILGLLDMSENDCVDFLVSNEILVPKIFLCESCCEDALYLESLADCAFRLRDEADRFALGCKLLDEYMHKAQYLGGISHGGVRWFLFGSKPIHWIVAALLAKNEK